MPYKEIDKEIDIFIQATPGLQTNVLWVHLMKHFKKNMLIIFFTGNSNFKSK